MGPIWRSQSLRDSPHQSNGIIAAKETFTVNERMGADRKVAAEVAPGVYMLRGWGIAHTIAIQAPGGWIIIDTGDTTQAAAEMRDLLEKTLGPASRWPQSCSPIGTTPTAPRHGTTKGRKSGGASVSMPIREAEVGLTPFRGVAQSRAIAQFGVLHPGPAPMPFPTSLASARKS